VISDQRKWLTDARHHLEILHEHLSANSLDDQLVLDAAALRLTAAIDSVSRIPGEVRSGVIPESRWRAIKGMRNWIAHAYGFIDPSVLRRTLNYDVVELERYVRELLDAVATSGS
jgi:uncharacterized protein with HEPN domain